MERSVMPGRGKAECYVLFLPALCAPLSVIASMEAFLEYFVNWQANG